MKQSSAIYVIEGVWGQCDTTIKIRELFRDYGMNDWVQMWNRVSNGWKVSVNGTILRGIVIWDWKWAHWGNAIYNWTWCAQYGTIIMCD